MSFDYHGCFILDKDPINASVLEGTLRSFGLVFAGASRSLVYEGGSTKSHKVPTRDWAAFIADGNGPTPSAFGCVEAKEFRFDFGFVTLPGLLDGPAPLDSLVRAAWLDISDQQLYGMGFALEDHESCPLANQQPPSGVDGEVLRGADSRQGKSARVKRTAASSCAAP
jgi:hypothetical protein